MRFQTTKRIPGEDPELVLGALEGCLRSVSNEVVRQGSQITLLGLGPSPRAINRRDTTVIDVKREDGATVIHADVRFQASAFLGTAPQETVVQEKLDRVFDDLLAQLGVSGGSNEKSDGATTARPEAITQKAEETPASRQRWQDVMALSESALVPAPATNPGADADDAVRPEPGLPAASEEIAQPEAAVVGEAVAPLLPASEETVLPSPAPEGTASPHSREENKASLPDSLEKTENQGIRPEAAEAVVTSETKQPEVEVTKQEIPVEDTHGAKLEPPATIDSASGKSTANVDAEAWSAPVPVTKAEETANLLSPPVDQKKLVPAVKKPDTSSRGPQPPVSPAGTVSKPPLPKVPARVEAPLKGASDPAPGMFALSGIEDEPETGSKWLKWSAWVAALIVLVVAPLVWLYMPSHPETAAAPVNQPAPAAAATPATQLPVPPTQPGDDPDPAVVVADWEAAMNSTDAAAQAAFYADPVERYFLRHNLSREAVKADKQAAINRRRGDWSVKMENIKVTRPDDNNAKARLIKHYTIKEDGKTASEWFVPSLLQMTRANGRWQITSERDLGWATSMDELGY